MMMTRMLSVLWAVLFLVACGAGDAPADEANAADTTAQDAPTQVADAPQAATENQGQKVTEEMVKAVLTDKVRLAMFAVGDLNEDGREDAIAVADATDEDRYTYILLQDESGLKQHQMNAMVAMCASCGGAMGDPLTGITVNGAYFSIEHMGGSREAWTKIITFKHVGENNFELHRDGGTVFDRMDPDAGEPVETVKTVKDFGKIPFYNYSYEEMW